MMRDLFEHVEKFAVGLGVEDGRPDAGDVLLQAGTNFYQIFYMIHENQESMLLS